jgi:hypothetical protein
MSTFAPAATTVVYPESDGQPMAHVVVREDALLEGPNGVPKLILESFPPGRVTRAAYEAMQRLREYAQAGVEEVYFFGSAPDDVVGFRRNGDAFEAIPEDEPPLKTCTLLVRSYLVLADDLRRTEDRVARLEARLRAAGLDTDA